MNRLFIILLFTVCYATVQLCAQNEHAGRMGYGVWGHGALSLHTADFDSLPGIPQARTRFTSATGFGFTAGVQLHIPFAPRWATSLRTGITAYTGRFSVLQQEQIAVPPQLATIRHTVDASFALLTAVPLLHYTALDNLHLMVGPDIGFLLSGTAIQRESIEDPPGATWVESGTASKELFNGSLGNPTRFQLALAMGVGYSIPLSSSRSVLLVPEFMASIPLTTLYTTQAWAVATYKVGASFLFTPQPTPLPIVRDTLYHRDTTARIVVAIDTENIVLDSVYTSTEQLRSPTAVLHRTTIQEYYVRNIPELKPLLSATIGASFVLETGEEAQAAKVTMEEFIVNKYVPLLPYVFFGKGQAQLAPRYQQISATQTKTFDIHQQHNLQALEAYYQVVDILGQRMRVYPNATLFITGCTALEDDAPSTLASQRALAVAQYLSERWGIPTSRLHTAARGIPEKPSNMAQPEGVEENRRVEFSSTEPQLFAPVILTDTMRTVDPPTVRFRLRLFSEAGIQHWSIVIMQRSNVLKTIQGKGAPPVIVDWSIGSDDIRPAASQPLEYVFAIVDSSGQSFATPKSSILFEQLTIQKKQVERRADKIIDRFSLLLFNYNEAQLSPYHATTMQFIQSKLTAKSTVKIIGTTDRLGDEQYNKQLSEERARETARALALSNATVTGFGEDAATYNNDLPEGRFYSRTVRIFIETPVEAKKN